MVVISRRSSLDITRAVVFAMVLREMQTRFSSRRLGGVWTLLEPILHLVLMMVIYAYAKDKTVPGMELPAFLLFGVLPFLLFKNISLNLMDSLEANRALFAYRQIQLMDTWVARFIVNFCISASVLMLMGFVLAFWGGYDLSIHAPLEWGVTWGVGLALAFGLGMIYCAIGEVLPESKTIIKLSYFPLYLLSGAIFPVWNLPPSVLSWLALNPWLHVIELFRIHASPSYPSMPQLNILYPAMWAGATLFVGFGLYRARRLHMMAS
ncbi:ABC transporter permease [Castellaniella ginsengisoli]|uniref:ABC transporter permease n=1 Tax=Castellaniella ginsengisoli TaxID=546114 RepID=A0AB39EVW2_9BURK